MSDILLAKPKLPEGFIDVSVGEAHVVRDILKENFFRDEHIRVYANPKYHPFEYPLPNGYQPLVELLEKKHGAPVIITNGAKQGLGAAFYALTKIFKQTVSMASPYWALIPPLVRMHGLAPITSSLLKGDAVLCVSPNNPDGEVIDTSNMIEHCIKNNKPLIHDAAYYSHVYLPRSYELKRFGDIQIYSISKLFGLSGLRVGYVVCPNRQFYQYIQEYMENMTVGVSSLSQIYVHELMREMEHFPRITERFEKEASAALTNAKEIMLKVDPRVLEVPANLPDIPGMFLFCKIKDFSLLKSAKINAIDGEYFGAPGYVRMNLAFDTSEIEEIVRRLNSVV